MKAERGKVLVSVCAATVLMSVGAMAGFTASGSGSFNAAGGEVTVGFDGTGGFVCMEGFTPVGSGSVAISFGSASGCGEEDFDFYYKAFGGFIEGTGEVSSPNFKAGQDDLYDDGFWYREGKFSSSVYYGDPENDGKSYADDPNGAWPAWTWGHPEADPFVSASDSGDDLGGAAGIGMGGFGVGDGSKIKADDSSYFYPIAFMGVNNYKNSSFGTYASDVSWNVVLYDKNHKEVFKKNYTTTAYYWETINFQNSNYGVICPRSTVDTGEVINDLAYNSAIHDNITQYWPVSGMDIDFVGDGKKDTIICSDAVKLKDQFMTDTFTYRPYGMEFGPGKKYELTFDGPYVYDASAAGCPAVNEEGIPDTVEKWPASCFKKVDTIWAEEGSKTRAFMRMTLKEADQDITLCHIKSFVPHLEGTLKEKADKMMQNILKKCNTSLEEVKKNVEDNGGCDVSGFHG